MISLSSIKLILFCFIFLQLTIHSQKQNISFQHFDIDQGLSSQNISAVFQDHKGFLWLNTIDGLYRYDGYEFVSYKYPKKEKFTRYIFSESICEDKEGTLWISSYNGGIEKFNPRTEIFKNYLPNPKQPATDWCNIVLAIFIDRNNVIWLGTGDGFYKFDLKKESFTYFNHDDKDPYSLAHKSVNFIYEDRTGLLWLATGGGLDRFDRETNKFYHYWHKDNTYWGETKTQKYWLLSITEDNEDIIWIGTSGGGLLKFDKKNEIFNLYYSHLNNSNDINLNVIQSLCFDGKGSIWLATRLGLNIFNIKTMAFQNYNHNGNDPGSLSDNTANSIFFDKAGSVWIATENGLNKSDIPNSNFTKYTFVSSQKLSHLRENISGFYEDNDNNIWILTNKGVKIFDPKEKKFIVKYEGINNGIFQDKSGNFFLVPERGGLYSTKNFIKWVCISDSLTADYPQLTRSLYKGSNEIWLGNIRGYLSSINSSTGKKKWIKYIKDEVQTTYEDSYGLVWFGGISTGIFCYKPEKDSIVEYNFNSKDENTISDNTFLSYYEDSNRNLWLGCGNAIVRYNRSQNNFTRYYGNEDFFSKGVKQILEDHHGNLWLSTGKGISNFNLNTNTFSDYYSINYFPEINFQSKVGITAKNGELYFGGENGFIRFNPDNVRSDLFVPPIVITSFKKFEKTFPFDKEIVLDHSDNFISFDFAALSFVNSSENQYAYKMDGVDDRWNYCGTRRYASYPNMPPGEYIFRVKGSSSNRIWNEAGTSIKILILPPWWKTIYAYLFYFLAGLGIIYSLWKLQLKRIRIIHEYKMSKFEAEKLHEVNELKSRFFTNISHEFRTPLTLILGPAEQILKKLNNDDLKEDASLIYRNAKKLNRLVNQLLDISKIEAQEMKLAASKCNLIIILKEIITSFHPFAERKLISLKFNSDIDELFVYLDKLNFEKILSNLLSNAIKFTPNGGIVEVKIKPIKKDDPDNAINDSNQITEKISEFVEISVSDTGIGIAKDQLDKIFDRFYQVDHRLSKEFEGTGVGLSLVKELVELHKGKIFVESEEGKGTMFRILLPLGKKHLTQEEIINKEVTKDELCKIESINITENILSESANNQSSLAKLNELDIDKPCLLIIEDNQDVRKYIKNIFEKFYKIIEANDGDDGLNKSVETIPDIIISDVMMPKLDGFQLCNKLKTNARTSHIPIILLTAKTALTDKINGLKIGADDYIMKPFEAEELKVRIENLLAQRKRLHKHFQKFGFFEDENKQFTSIDKKFLHSTFETINSHISDSSFNIDIFADEMTISRSLLHKKLVALVGESPGDLIKRVRLNKAANLLGHKTGNITEIAYEVGFSDSAYFATCFKKQFGISPSKFHHTHLSK